MTKSRIDMVEASAAPASVLCSLKLPNADSQEENTETKLSYTEQETCSRLARSVEVVRRADLQMRRRRDGSTSCRAGFNSERTRVYEMFLLFCRAFFLWLDT